MSRRSVPTWRMSAAELARVVAGHLGWTGRPGGWVYDAAGRPVAHGWASTAELMRRRGWIVPGAGVNWRRVPHCQV